MCNKSPLRLPASAGDSWGERKTSGLSSLGDPAPSLLHTTLNLWSSFLITPHQPLGQLIRGDDCETALQTGSLCKLTRRLRLTPSQLFSPDVCWSYPLLQFSLRLAWTPKSHFWGKFSALPKASANIWEVPLEPVSPSAG